MLKARVILFSLILSSILVSNGYASNKCLSKLKILTRTFSLPLEILRSKGVPSVQELREQGNKTLRNFVMNPNPTLSTLDVKLLQKHFNKEFRLFLGMFSLRTGVDGAELMRAYENVFNTPIPDIHTLLENIKQTDFEKFLDQSLSEIFLNHFIFKARKADSVSKIVFEKTLELGRYPRLLAFANKAAKWIKDPKVIGFAAVAIVFIPAKAIFSKPIEFIQQTLEVFGLQRADELHEETLIQQTLISIEGEDRKKIDEIMREVYGTEITKEEIDVLIRSSVELYAHMIIEYRTAMNETASIGRGKAVTLAMNTAQVLQTVALAKERLRSLAIDYNRVQQKENLEIKEELLSDIELEKEEAFQMLEYAHQYAMLLLIGNVFAADAKLPTLPQLPESEVMDLFELLSNEQNLNGKTIWNTYLRIQMEDSSEDK